MQHEITTLFAPPLVGDMVYWYPGKGRHVPGFPLYGYPLLPAMVMAVNFNGHSLDLLLFTPSSGNLLSRYVVHKKDTDFCDMFGTNAYWDFKPCSTEIK